MSPSTSARKARRETNVLHRRTERLEDLLAWSLGVLLAVAVVLALAAALASHDTVETRARAEAAERTQVSAVLVTDAAMIAGAERTGARRATVRWTGADGIERTGSTLLHSPRSAGETVPVWTTADGRLVFAPATEGDAMGAAVLSGALTALAAGAVVALLGRQALAWTGRRYARAWEQEWERVGPVWSGRARS